MSRLENIVGAIGDLSYDLMNWDRLSDESEYDHDTIKAVSIIKDKIIAIERSKEFVVLLQATGEE